MVEQDMNHGAWSVAPRWTRRAIASLLTGTGLAALGAATDAKKKKKKKKKKSRNKGAPSTPPTPPTCATTCGDRVCGDNGCGGSCGSCGAGQFCDAGQCLAPLSYEFERTWGSYGTTGQSKFYSPWGIAVDEDANVYVADSGNARIQKFSSNGAFVTEWGSPGVNDGQFQSPAGVATGPSGQVYVADSLNNRIQRFTNAGGHVLSWGVVGPDPGQLQEPQGIAVNPTNGNVYTVERSNDRVQVFAGSVHVQTIMLVDGGNPVYARAVAVTAAGRILFVSRSVGRVFEINEDTGAIRSFGANGSGNGQFSDPNDVAVDAAGNIFVADRGNHRIQVLNEDGEFVTAFGQMGSGEGEFLNPIGVDVDSNGNVYVTDLSNNRVQKFRPVGARRKHR
ncbi:MAG: 6-bladed beta-propeller [Thermomicrobiales bacterium]